MNILRLFATWKSPNPNPQIAAEPMSARGSSCRGHSALASNPILSTAAPIAHSQAVEIRSDNLPVKVDVRATVSGHGDR